MKTWPWRLSLILLSTIGALELNAAPAMEKIVLFGPESAKTWSVAECTLDSSTNRMRDGNPSLHWHVTVDHFAGEKNYPIGWPRFTTTIKDPAKRDWSDYDFLHFWIYTETSRDKLPLEPAGYSLAAPDKENTFARTLKELKKGEWVEFTIPLSQLPRKDDVRSIQFHISESNYRHLDQLDFYISEITLLRYAELALLNFEPESAVVFNDAQYIPFRFEVAGLHKGGLAYPRFALSRGGKVWGRIKDIGFARGPARASFRLDSVPPAGDYELSVDLGNGPQPASTKVRVVESPWKSK